MDDDNSRSYIHSFEFKPFVSLHIVGKVASAQNKEKADLIILSVSGMHITKLHPNEEHFVSTLTSFLCQLQLTWTSVFFPP